MLADKEGLYTGHPEVTYPTDKPKLKELKLLTADADELEKRSAEIKKRFTEVFRRDSGKHSCPLLKPGCSVASPTRAGPLFDLRIRRFQYGWRGHSPWFFCNAVPFGRDFSREFVGRKRHQPQPLS